MLLVALPPLCIFVVASMNTDLNRHFRYVIPTLAIWFVIAGASVAINSPAIRTVAVMLVGLHFFASWVQHPHLIGYFNLLSGGSEAGHRHLNNSNVDWGQDVYGLVDFVERNPEVQPIRCAYFGHCSPDLFGVRTESIEPWGEVSNGLPPQGPGWYVLSTEYLIGADWRAPGATEASASRQAGPYAYFQSFEPYGRIGTSLWIYHIMPPGNLIEQSAYLAGRNASYRHGGDDAVGFLEKDD